MRFKVIPGSDTFIKLTELNKRIIAAREAANKFCRKIGGKSVANLGVNAAGGIDAIEFDHPPSAKKWMPVGRKHQKYFQPIPKTNPEVIEEIKKLPVVTYAEMNAIVGFTPQYVIECGERVTIRSIWVFFCKNDILIQNEQGTKFNPGPDLVEILESEFESIKKTVNT